MSFGLVTLTTAAGVDPWALHRQVADGHPEQIERQAAAFFRVAGSLAAARDAEMRARRLVGGGLAGDGADALDRNIEVACARTMLHAGAEHLPRIARVLVEVGECLSRTQSATAAALVGLTAGLDRVDAAAAAFASSTAGRLAGAEREAAMSGYLLDAVGLVRRHGATIGEHIDRYESLLAAATATLHSLGYVAALPNEFGGRPPIPAPGADAAGVAAWWRGLSPGERQTLLHSHYDVLGQLPGLPARVLGQANQHRLVDDIARQLTTILSAGATHGAAATTVVLAALWRLKQDLGVDRALGASAGVPRCLLTYSPQAAKGVVGAAVAIGDPDIASDTAVLVPGTSHSAADLDEIARDADALYHQMSAPAKSVVVWLDGDEPDDLVPDAAIDTYADADAPALTHDLAGLRAGQAAAGNDTGHVTAIGHSYGSYILGKALAASAHRYVDDAVFIGSPGVGVDHAADLGMDPHHVWSGQSTSDPILLVKNRFTPGVDGINPADADFGDQHFDVTGAHGHSQYLQGRSLANIARIADGSYGAVHRVGPLEPSLYQAVPDALDGVYIDPLRADVDVVDDLVHGHPVDAIGDYADGLDRQVHHLARVPRDVGSAIGDVGSAIGDLGSAIGDAVGDFTTDTVDGHLVDAWPWSAPTR